MGTDEQEEVFGEDYHVPFEEMEKNVKGLDCGEDGKPKGIIRERDNQDIRVCDLCGKTFVGGKALGGHRRSHFQTKKVAGLTIKIKKQHVTKMGCCICNKDFPSMRSLFGHMRAHPDRDWRGIQPPLQSPHRKSSSSVDDADNGEQLARSDLLKSVSNWSKTERRRRKSTGAVAAAQILVLMASGEHERQAGKKKMKKKKAKCLMEKLRDSETEEIGLNIDDKNVQKAVAESYKCSTCDRSFGTFQGLGGHRSIHNKDSKKNRELEETNVIAAFADTFRIDESRESNMPIPSPSPGEAIQTGPRRRMDFDLNQPYDMDMEDEGIY